MASENTDEKALKQCLQGLITIASNVKDEFRKPKSSSDEQQLINDATKKLKGLLDQSISSLTPRCRNYLLNILHQYKYNVQEKKFPTPFTKQILHEFAYAIKGRYSLIDACQAAWKGDQSIVKSFIENYSTIKDKSGLYGTTLLYSAARNDHFNIVKYLIEIGKCSVNAKNEDYAEKDSEPTMKAAIGSTALHAACYHGHLRIVQYLVEHGADYFITNNVFETSLQNAQSRSNIRKFFEDFLLPGYSRKLNIFQLNTILEEIKKSKTKDCFWEYKAFTNDQWLPFSDELSDQLQQSLNIDPDKKFKIEIPLKSSTDVYQVSMAQFLRSSKNTDHKENHAWIRCRGSALLNFHSYSRWQIMFIKHPTGLKSSSPPLQPFDMKITTTIELNSWYNCNDRINFLLERAMNYRQKFITIDLDFINNERIRLDLENFTYTNEQNTTEGFLRWIPKIIANSSKLMLIDNFLPLKNSDVILLTVPYLKQAQTNGNISNDEMNQYDLKFESVFDSVENVDSSHKVMNENDWKNFVNVIQGDLINTKSDVIVICASSKYLVDSVMKAGGKSFQKLYETKLKEKPKSPVISISTAGKLPSKAVYFVPWQPDPNSNLLCQSIELLVTNVMEKAANENYKSIAFPAIGCGEYGCPIKVVAEVLVREVQEQLIKHPMEILFVIQADKTDIYHEFQRQIESFNQQEQSSTTKSQSLDIEKGRIEIEQGDITKQKVDVIIGSSSSENLRQILIRAGGDEVDVAYNNEYIKNPNSLIIVTPPGQLSCRKVFFIKWEPHKDPDFLRQSIIDLMWNVIQNAMSNNFTSIAFPAIGCGEHACSVDIVVKTMVNEMKKQIEQRKLPWLVKFIIHPDKQTVYDEFCKQLLSTEESLQTAIRYQIPSTWQKSKDDKLRFILSKDSDEYNSIFSKFNKAMKGEYSTIVKIERIQNERWLMQYLAHAADFQKRLNKDTQQKLYHGCGEDAANSIIQDCFNRSFAGVNGISYGVGVYFSTNAAYSHGFTKPNTNGERCMFVSRVLIGKTTLGNSSMKTRPVGYDSTTDKHHIYVTYHDAQAYAEYLITYK